VEDLTTFPVVKDESVRDSGIFLGRRQYDNTMHLPHVNMISPHPYRLQVPPRSVPRSYRNSRDATCDEQFSAIQGSPHNILPRRLIEASQSKESTIEDHKNALRDKVETKA